MLSNTLLSTVLALAGTLTVSAQTTTECNPLKSDCPANQAIGKNRVSCDFTQGACDAMEHIPGKEVTYGSRGAVMELTGGGQAPTLRTKHYMYFGRVEVNMQAAPGRGLVTAIMMLSDDLDEIDLEALGAPAQNRQIQSNVFAKGDATRHDLERPLDADNLTGISHRYAIDWTPDRIEWSVDGVPSRVLTRADVGDARFPQTPCRVSIGPWVAGGPGNAPGTIEWAGGEADFSAGPASAYFRSIVVTDYAGGKKATDDEVEGYSYADRSGSSNSIRVKFADGGSSTGTSTGAGNNTATATATLEEGGNSNTDTTANAGTNTSTNADTDNTNSSESSPTSDNAIYPSDATDSTIANITTTTLSEPAKAAINPTATEISSLWSTVTSSTASTTTAATTDASSSSSSAASNSVRYCGLGLVLFAVLIAV